MKKWFEIKNLTQESADLYFYGDIVGDEWGKWTDDDTCPKDVVDALKMCEGKTLNIYINSGGGDVFGGIAIYNILKRHNQKKTVYVDGIAGSIASVIAMVGDEIVIPKNAYMMIHKPWTSAWGANSTELRKIADTLDTLEEGILNIYETRLTEETEIETVKGLLEEETWLTGDEASKYFKVTVTDEIKALSSIGDSFKHYQSIPKDVSLMKDKVGESDEKNEDNTKTKLQIELDLLDM